jgi:SAM-dependent methyltransferase
MTDPHIPDLGAVSALEALLKTVGPVEGLRIVDIGCGEGQLARALARRGARVTGFDPFIAGTDMVAEGAGFYRLARAAADALPEPDGTADLVLFVFSLHHVPEQKLAGALAEARRVLRPSGRLYVAEPLPQGAHHYVAELFHDETSVRKAAAAALARFARPAFATDRVATYTDRRTYADFDAFARRMIANMRFNNYTEQAVLAPDVRQRFAETLAAYGGHFDQPVRIDCLEP